MELLVYPRKPINTGGIKSFVCGCQGSAQMLFQSQSKAHCADGVSPPSLLIAGVLSSFSSGTGWDCGAVH